MCGLRAPSFWKRQSLSYPRPRGFNKRSPLPPPHPHGDSLRLKGAAGDGTSPGAGTPGPRTWPEQRCSPAETWAGPQFPRPLFNLRRGKELGREGDSSRGVVTKLGPPESARVRRDPHGAYAERLRMNAGARGGLTAPTF